MVTAVDSSILLDVLTDDPRHCVSSLSVLRIARSAGTLIVCPIVWAEVRAFFSNGEEMSRALSHAGIGFDAFDRDCADLAGQRWAEYRRQGGSRMRLIADFLIGAHARVRANCRLATRDRGFFRSYFSELEIIGTD